MTTQSEWKATGRRKTAVASVKLLSGTGIFHVNRRLLEDYFPESAQRLAVYKPLELSETLKKFDFEARVRGGGLTGQADALCLALSRALVRWQPEIRPKLKEASLLTRDPRMKERKKSGQPGARKRFQFSKR
ncbi:30S ribosomal protein S9 [Methylacidimicrobium tartarophylax]|uniref:Small ribosomal subunit protein uS9 n=1 Tax=Methylacidimicrobium tartarophylax TaxID=1041768 RepID=A0A5E6MH51_9BACT|nr:30S ribosomal protein S9 [Methylacidimicrobium tartarophylax]VVM04805.1 30S ribosomal protein S9 [Methylacidimicrobium tartarophylax]